MSLSQFDQDTLIYREMMTHTPLFAHRNPQNVAVLDATHAGLTQEILKHANVTTIWQPEAAHEKLTDPRVKYVETNMSEFLSQTAKNSLDVLIIGSTTPFNWQDCINALHADGIFIQLSDSSFDLTTLKTMQQQLKLAGFADILPLNFPQPQFTSGWRAAIMACKEGTIKRPREKDIFNKTFTTGYYNLDMHRAAFALPEFMREEFV